MYHVPHLILVFFFADRKRSVELCKRDNKACLQDKQYSIQIPKNKQPFKHRKPQVIRRILSN